MNQPNVTVCMYVYTYVLVNVWYGDSWQVHRKENGDHTLASKEKTKQHRRDKKAKVVHAKQ